ncbi:MAG: MFS transporter [Actinomycetales bacterium]|nr:MFS transporter [Actinomycetales bacterium]
MVAILPIDFSKSVRHHPRVSHDPAPTDAAQDAPPDTAPVAAPDGRRAVAPDVASARRRSLAFHRNFRQLWIGDALGQLGAQLTLIALPVYAVETLHATELEMGVLTAAETIAFPAIGLLVGAWVDRMNKRRTLIVADVVRAAALAVVVVAGLTGHGSVPLLVGVAVVMSCATVFFDVAHQSYVPGLVGLEHIAEGNAKLQATQSVAIAVGPGLGGQLLRVVTAPALVGVTVVTYLVSALFVGRIRHDEDLPPRAPDRSLRREIAEGLRFVVGQPLLRRIVATTGISNLFGSVTGALMVIYALRVLGLEEAGLGAVLSAGAVGGVVGALLADRVTRAVGEGRTIALAAVGWVPAFALTPLALPLSEAGVPVAAVLIVGQAVATFCIVVYNVAQVSFRQRLCPPALLGRMNASVRFIVWGGMPLGGLLGGVLGTHLGVVPTLWVAVAGTALAVPPVALSPLARLRDLPTRADAAS